MPRLYHVILTIVISSFLFTSINAETINVPQDYETIQEAIDNASNGDSIRVAAGEYVENIVLDGLTVLLVGNPENPAAVTINGENNHTSTVTFTGNIRSSTHLNGFTITGGLDIQRLGGGVHCDESSPSLRNLIVEGNTGGSGGGIQVVDGNPPMDNILIQNNESRSYGGGITLMGSASPVMTNITIANNHSINRGGGLASFSRGRPELEDSELHENSADINGGGIFSSGVMFLRNVDIYNNDCRLIGGGIYANGNLSFIGGSLTGNQAESAGGAYLDGVQPSLERLLIANNQAEEFGGGLYLSGAANGRCSATIVHTTFAGNIAGEAGGGIYCTDNGNPTLRDCILWNADAAEISFDGEEDENAVNISYSDVEGGEDGIEVNRNGDVNWGAGNIDDDPLFVDAEAGDYHLSWADYPEDNETKSPCIDAGNPNLDPDPDESRADMGVYWFEQAHPTIEVTPLVFAFGSIAFDEERELSLSIRNVGESVLIGSISLEQEGDVFWFDEEYNDFRIEPGEGIQVPVFFRAGNEPNYSGILSVFSNDPDFPTIEAQLSGGRLNQGPQVGHRIHDFSILEDAEPAVIANLNDVFFDNDGDSLTFSVNSDELAVSIEENGDFTLSPPPDYNDERNLVQITAADNWEGMIPLEEVVMRFYVEVLPMNDAPEAFHLRAPSANEFLDRWDVLFQWDTAVQNEWEVDEVTYTLELMRNDSAVTIDSIAENEQFVQLGAVLDALGRDEDGEFTELIWHVLAVDDSTMTPSNREFSVFVPNQTSAPAIEDVPTEFSLSGVYPNPFNSTTTIGYTIPAASMIHLAVFDMSGRKVARLADGVFNAGRYTVSWHAEGMPTGVYVVALDAGGVVFSERVALVR